MKDFDAEVLDLTASLVAIDSQNPGPGEAQLAAYVQEWLVGAGLEHETVEVVPGRPNILVKLDFGDGPSVGLSGHLDTKPVGDAASEWLTDPLTLTVKDGIAYGLGASDMKGAVAAMLLAMRDLRGRSDCRGSAWLVLTSDEEQGSNAGAKSLVRAGALPPLDGLVIGEPCGTDRGWENLFLVSRGICCLDIEVVTRQGHSGLSPRFGENAIQVAARGITALSAFVPPIAHPGKIPASPTVNPGMLIEGGVCYGVWPGRCVFGLELRTVPGMKKDDVVAEVKRFLDAEIGDAATVTVTPKEGALGWMEAVEIDPEHRLVTVTQRICEEVLGAPLDVAAYAGGTDAAFFMGEGSIPTIAALGPGWLTVAHASNEHVGVDQLASARTLYRSILSRFLSAGGE